MRKTSFINKEYCIYTGIFFAMMTLLWLYYIYAGMVAAPKFTYAQF